MGPCESCRELLHMKWMSGASALMRALMASLTRMRGTTEMQEYSSEDEAGKWWPSVWKHSSEEDRRLMEPPLPGDERLETDGSCIQQSILLTNDENLA